MAAACPPDVVQYFEEQWWGCPRLWAAHCSGSPNFHVTTTNHAESFHQKIKRGLNNKTSLSAAATYLCETSTNMTTARNMKAIADAISFKYDTEKNSETVNIIKKWRHQFASRLVIQQLIIAEKLKEVYKINSQNELTYRVQSHRSCHETQATSCDCSFFFLYQSSLQTYVLVTNAPGDAKKNASLPNSK
ncbi:hypothetical protein RRG08_001492 [Elysia crispata]|nr:hypothetical protein RRG08_001492 [Elysia crispata]